ncbi:MAG: SRPBCC family protein [Acidobacteriota bacterium]|nr:SRPBCC family protein [Acidobacteriota bacterium]
MSTLYLLGGFLLLLMVATAIAVAIGSMIDEHYRCSTARSFNKSPIHVFAALRDIGNHAAWRKLVKTSVPAGNGFRLSYLKNPVDTRLSIVREEEPGTLIMEGAEIEGPMEWTWTFTIEAEGEKGSRVTIEEEGVAKNAWYRFVLKHISGYDKVITDLLRDLDEHLTAAED